MSPVRTPARAIALPWRRLLLLPAAMLLLLLLLAPAGAAAAPHTFLDTDDIFPPGNGVFGPATVYPATIAVADVPGTVTGVKVTLLDIETASPDDMDIGLRGPNGVTVMLVSDVCGEAQGVFSDDWVVEDQAPAMISDNGPCPSNQTLRLKPSNYVGNSPEPDDLSVEGGPAGPYRGELAALAGGSANGSWELFALDDNSFVTGLFLGGWALTLEVEPPPPVIVVGPAAPPIVTTVAAPPAAAHATGKRAAALAKCKKKKHAKGRARCRAAAHELPL